MYRYYGNADKERNGPVSFAEMTQLFEDKVIHPRTKVWAQGLEGWRLLQQVAQLKWTLVAKGQAVLNESEMSSLILGMLVTVCRLVFKIILFISQQKIMLVIFE